MFDAALITRASVLILGLGLVGIGDEAALHHLRGARHLGEQGGHQAAGAGSRGRWPIPAPTWRSPSRASRVPPARRRPSPSASSILGDEAALHHLRGARHLGEQGGHQAAGAGFRGDEATAR
jgi:hypothetical protein